MYAFPNLVCNALRRAACILFAVAFTCIAGRAYAQPKADTADKVKIIIANTGAIEHYTTDSGSYNKFVHDVIVYVGSSRVDLQACKLEYSIVSPK